MLLIPSPPPPPHTHTHILHLEKHILQILEYRITQPKFCTAVSVYNLYIHKRWRIRRGYYCSENLNKFKECINKLTFSELYFPEDPNLAYNYFCELFKLCYDLCFPSRMITDNAHGNQKWVSLEVMKCIKRKRILLWQSWKNPSNANNNKYKHY